VSEKEERRQVGGRGGDVTVCYICEGRKITIITTKLQTKRPTKALGAQKHLGQKSSLGATQAISLNSSRGRTRSSVTVLREKGNNE